MAGLSCFEYSYFPVLRQSAKRVKGRVLSFRMKNSSGLSG